MSICIIFLSITYVALIMEPAFMAIMYMLFGWGAYVVPAVLALLGTASYEMPNYRAMAVLSMLWITIAITSLPCLLSLLFIQTTPYIIFPNDIRENGGLVGSLITEILLQIFGSIFQSDPKTTIGLLIFAIISLSISLIILFINNVDYRGKKNGGRGKKVIINNN